MWWPHVTPSSPHRACTLFPAHQDENLLTPPPRRHTPPVVGLAEPSLTLQPAQSWFLPGPLLPSPLGGGGRGGWATASASTPPPPSPGAPACAQACPQESVNKEARDHLSSFQGEPAEPSRLQRDTRQGEKGRRAVAEAPNPQRHLTTPPRPAPRAPFPAALAPPQPGPHLRPHPQPLALQKAWPLPLPPPASASSQPRRTCAGLQEEPQPGDVLRQQGDTA